MQKTFLILLLVFVSNWSLAQDYFIFSPMGIEFQMENPTIFKTNNIKQVIERHYLSMDNGKLHMIINRYYDENGYPLKEEYGKSYPSSNQPDSTNLTSYANFSYETLDSFIYQRKQYIRFYGNKKERLKEPDTLLNMIHNYYNPYNLENQKDEKGKIFGRYKYDKNGHLVELQLNKNKYAIKYKKGVKKSMEVEQEKLPKIPFPQYDKTLKYTYNKEQQLTELLIINGPQKTLYKYYYDDNGLLIKKEMFIGRPKPIIHTYEYIFK